MSSLSLEDDATELSLLRLLLVGNCLGRLTLGGGGELEVDVEAAVAAFLTGCCCMLTILAAASSSPLNRVGVAAAVTTVAGGGAACGCGGGGGCGGAARGGRLGGSGGGCDVSGDSGEEELPSWSTKEWIWSDFMSWNVCGQCRHLRAIRGRELVLLEGPLSWKRYVSE